jgi:hypothetical protein
MEVSPQIVVEIESLRFEGLSRGEAELASAALHGELQRLFNERGLPSGLQADSTSITLDRPIEMRPGMRPEQLGALAAQALFARWES